MSSQKIISVAESDKETTSTPLVEQVSLTNRQEQILNRDSMILGVCMNTATKEHTIAANMRR